MDAHADLGTNLLSSTKRIWIDKIIVTDLSVLPVLKFVVYFMI